VLERATRFRRGLLARKLRILPARVTRNEREYITINGKPIENEVERTYIGQRFEIEIEDVGAVPADMLSEGTLLVLGLLTVLYTTPGLRLLLLDDIERGLHPNAQRDVIRGLRAVVASDPGYKSSVRRTRRTASTASTRVKSGCYSSTRADGRGARR
jgi:hypothetical protein